LPDFLQICKMWGFGLIPSSTTMLCWHVLSNSNLFKGRHFYCVFYMAGCRLRQPERRVEGVCGNLAQPDTLIRAL